jgi:tetratricopeptide (TPR) repeat protein
VLHSGRPSDAQLARARHWLEDAIKQKKTVGLLVCLADLLDLRGRHPEAEATYGEVLKIDPKSVEALNNLAWLRAYHDHDGADALKLVNSAIEIVGPVPELLDTRAGAHLALNQIDSAIKDLQDALSLPPPNKTVLATIQLHLAEAYQLAGKKTDAETYFVQAKMDPDKLHPLEKPGYERLVTALAQK